MTEVFSCPGTRKMTSLRRDRRKSRAIMNRAQLPGMRRIVQGTFEETMIAINAVVPIEPKHMAIMKEKILFKSVTHVINS